jgi:YcxB-like protein
MHFTLNTEDMTRMQRFAMQRVMSLLPNKSLIFGLRVLCWFAIAFMFFRFTKAYECCETTQPILQQAGYAALAAAVLFAVTNYILNLSLVGNAVIEGGWFLSQQSVSVHQGGLVHSTRLGESNIPWSAFVWRAEDDRNFYLFIDQGIGFVFPKASIPDTGQQGLIRANVVN